MRTNHASFFVICLLCVISASCGSSPTGCSTTEILKEPTKPGQPDIKCSNPEAPVNYFREEQKDNPSFDSNALYYSFQSLPIAISPSGTSINGSYFNRTFKNQVHEAANIWNEESVGPALIYDPSDIELEYTIDNKNHYKKLIDVDNALCDKKHAHVLIRYLNKCVNKYTCRTDALAYASPRPGCRYNAEIVVQAYRPDANGSLRTNNFRYAWDEGNHDGSHPWLRGVLTHELGHVLGLDHPDDEKMAVPGVQESVMKSVYYEGFSHLYPWERACVPFRWGERKMGIKYMTINANGDISSGPTAKTMSISSSPYYTSKETQFAIPEYNVNTHSLDYFSIIQRFDFRTEIDRREKAIGSLDLPIRDSVQKKSTAVDFSTRPTYSKVTTNNNITGALFYNQSSNISGANPPLVKIDYFNGNTNQSLSSLTPVNEVPLLLQDSTLGQINLRSHVPTTVSYDPASNKILIASVPTQPLATNPVEGGIIIGFNDDPTSIPSTLTHYEYVHKHLTNLDILSSEPQYNYNAKTFFAPGVACAEKTGALSQYNCVVAWVDRGNPYAPGVLYTWFRVEKDHLEWEGKAYRLNASDFPAMGHVSAAYVGNAIVMAFRTVNGDVLLLKNNLSHLESWKVVTRIEHTYSSPTLSSEIPSASFGKANGSLISWGVAP